MPAAAAVKHPRGTGSGIECVSQEGRITTGRALAAGRCTLIPGPLLAFFWGDCYTVHGNGSERSMRKPRRLRCRGCGPVS